MASRRTWTDDQLAYAIRKCVTWSAAAKELGLQPKGNALMRLRRHAARLGLNVEHLPAYGRGEVLPLFSATPGGSPRAKADPEMLRDALTDAHSWSEVLRRLDISVCLYNIKRIREDAAVIGVIELLPARFCGYRHCGKELPRRARKLYCSLTCHHAELIAQKVQRWLETGEIGRLDRPGEAIRSYLLTDQGGRCAVRGNVDTWMGRSLRFILDHIDGDSSKSSSRERSADLPKL